MYVPRLNTLAASRPCNELLLTENIYYLVLLTLKDPGLLPNEKTRGGGY